MASLRVLFLVAVALLALPGTFGEFYSPVPARRLLFGPGGSPAPAARRLFEGVGSPVPYRRLAEVCATPLDVLSTMDEYSTFMSAVEVADLQDILSDANGQLTLYVPHNAAFDAFFLQHGLQADEWLSSGKHLAAFFKAHLNTEGDLAPAFKLAQAAPIMSCGNTVYAVDNVAAPADSA